MHPILNLQRIIGNRAVQRLIRAKLAIGHPADVYEEEADRVAQQVVGSSSESALQRKCVCGGMAGPGGECEECREKRISLQRAGRNSDLAGQIDSSVPPIVDDVLRSRGEPLDPAIRAFMEPRFGHDFTQVRVHTDAQAARSAERIGALAYTVGPEIVFGSARYSPGTIEGRQLLAHELTHVVQSGSWKVDRPIEVGSSENAEESEAASVGISAHATGSQNSDAILRRQPKGRTKPESCSGWTCLSDRSKCNAPDPGKEGSGSASTAWSLSAMIDVDVPTAAEVGITTFGHSYVKFNESNGAEYTYGFYPRSQAEVVLGGTRETPGCIVHPDTTHAPCVDYEEKYSLTKADYDKALDNARLWCTSSPNYQLFNINCTTFVARIVESAGKTLPTYRGTVSEAKITADNPNTLLESLRARDEANKPKRVRIAEQVIFFARSEELRMAFSMLNGLWIVEMLDALEGLNARKYLDHLIEFFAVAQDVDKPRLMVAMRSAKLKSTTAKPTQAQISEILALAPRLEEKQKEEVTAYLNR